MIKPPRCVACDKPTTGHSHHENGTTDPCCQDCYQNGEYQSWCNEPAAHFYFTPILRRAIDWQRVGH